MPSLEKRGAPPECLPPWPAFRVLPPLDGTTTGLMNREGPLPPGLSTPAPESPTPDLLALASAPDWWGTLEPGPGADSEVLVTPVSMLVTDRWPLDTLRIPWIESLRNREFPLASPPSKPSSMAMILVPFFFFLWVPKQRQRGRSSASEIRGGRATDALLAWDIGPGPASASREPLRGLAGIGREGSPRSIDGVLLSALDREGTPDSTLGKGKSMVEVMSPSSPQQC